MVPLYTALSSFKCHFYKAAHTAYRGRRNTAVVKKKKKVSIVAEEEEECIVPKLERTQAFTLS